MTAIAPAECLRGRRDLAEDADQLGVAARQDDGVIGAEPDGLGQDTAPSPDPTTTIPARRGGPSAASALTAAASTMTARAPSQSRRQFPEFAAHEAVSGGRRTARDVVGQVVVDEGEHVIRHA